MITNVYEYPNFLIVLIILSYIVNGNVAIGEEKRLRIDPNNQNRYDDAVVPLIIGGRDAPKGDFKDIVCNIVGSNGFGHYCGCTIIAPDVALSAAHCYFPEFTVGDFVEIGKYYRDKDNKKNKNVFKLRITEVILNKKFSNRASSGYDIMVLKLGKEYPKPPVTLQLTKKQWSEEDEFTVVGWGTTKPDKFNKLAKKLQSVDVNYVDFKTCEKFWKSKQIPSLKTYFCAYSKGKDSCAGDSGGPIFTKIEDEYVQVGLVSFGTAPCAVYPGGVYTDLSDKKIKNFIDQSVCHKKKGLSPKSKNCKDGKLTNII